MINTTPAKFVKSLVVATAMACSAALTGPAAAAAEAPTGAAATLTAKQQAIAPIAAATYLKTHLFGDIFARDNLDWQGRELATVGALAAMSGVESQLLSHIRVSLNVGLTVAQLRGLADVLGIRGQQDAAARLRTALDKRS